MSPRLPLILDPRFQLQKHEVNLRRIRLGYWIVWLSLVLLDYGPFVSVIGWILLLVAFGAASPNRPGGFRAVAVVLAGFIVSVYCARGYIETSRSRWPETDAAGYLLWETWMRLALTWVTFTYIEHLLSVFSLGEDSKATRRDRWLVLFPGILGSMLLSWSRNTVDFFDVGNLAVVVFALMLLALYAGLGIYRLNDAIECCHASALAMNQSGKREKNAGMGAKQPEGEKR